MSRYDEALREMRNAPHRWLVTGVAGFIGSHLLEQLLVAGQTVIGLDNFSTGQQRNLDQALASAGASKVANFELIHADIRSLEECYRACARVDYVLHHAAFVSVPASLEDPVACHEHNVTGFLNILVAVRQSAVRRLVYASSSAVYGDSPEPIKRENQPVSPLSPYGATKAINELYASTFAEAYGVESIGLRYFNVYGPRQDPNGAYAAVIPKWTEKLMNGESPVIYGDGSSSRDFVHVSDVVQANLLSATAKDVGARSTALNIASGDQTTLAGLYAELQSRFLLAYPSAVPSAPTHEKCRAGDIFHSLADISKARAAIGYAPQVDLRSGIAKLFQSPSRLGLPTYDIDQSLLSAPRKAER